MTSLTRKPIFRTIGTVRQRLVLLNILCFAVLMSALGTVVRFEAAKTIYGAIDHDLYMRSNPPRFREGHPPDDPPQPAATPNQIGPSPLDQAHPPSGPHSEPPHNAQQQNPFGRFRWRNSDRNEIRPRFLPVPLPSDRQSDVPYDLNAYKIAVANKDTYSTIYIASEPIRIYTKPIRFHGTLFGVSQIPYPLTDAMAAVHSLDHVLLTLLPIALLCAGIAGWTVTNSVLKRVSQMTRSASNMRVDDSLARLPVIGHDEFAELSSTFNDLLDRLHAALSRQLMLLDQQRRFTADASHELKSPLTVIKGNASLALSSAAPETHLGALRQIDQAADVMSHLVQDLLILAASDEGHISNDRIEILASEVIDRIIGRLVPEQAHRIHVKLADSASTLYGNESELIRLFTNLIDNSLRYSFPNSVVEITIINRTAFTEVQIKDHGEGLSADDIPHLGERFFRVDSARARTSGGSGLGLAICREIVQSHRGLMDISSIVGKGSVVKVQMPRTPITEPCSS